MRHHRVMPKRIKHSKRPKDMNQLARQLVEHSASQPPETMQLGTHYVSISEYMAAIGRKGGQIGGKRRLKTMTVEQRREAATKAAKARWRRANSE